MKELRTTPQQTAKRIVLYTDNTTKSNRLMNWLESMGYRYDIKQITGDGMGPILQINDTFCPPGWLYEGNILQTEKIREALV